MQNGITYKVLPFMLPIIRLFSLLFISSGSIQLLVGPASSLAAAADKSFVFDPGYIAGITKTGKTIRTLFGIQANESAFAQQANCKADHILPASHHTSEWSWLRKAEQCF